MTTLEQAAKTILQLVDNLTSEEICKASHHTKKEQHKFYEPCPVVDRIIKAANVMHDGFRGTK